MARIRHMTQTYSRNIRKFLGVNESVYPTDLRDGEASGIKNYRVTLDNKLQKRGGMVPQASFVYTDMLACRVNGVDGLACIRPNGILDWRYVADDGTVATASMSAIYEAGGLDPHMFSFGGRLYIMTGEEYYCWDGTTKDPEKVEGYVPLVATACAPSGGGTELEGLNVLSDSYRVQFSPDGESTEFVLPTTDTTGVLGITENGEEYTGDWWYIPDRKSVLFRDAPARGTNTIEVTACCIDITNTHATHDTTNTYTLNAQAGLEHGSWTIDISEDATEVASISKAGLKVLSGGTVLEYGWRAYVDEDGASHISLHVYAESDSETGNTVKVQAYWYLRSSDKAWDRTPVVKQKYGVAFNGNTDNRVFLWGDGSDTAVYSGIDEDGQPRADYFPILNQMTVGLAGDPITGMVRHYNALLVFKRSECFRVTYESQTLTGGNVIAGFNLRPIHSERGNEAENQARLCYNNPRTVCEDGIYEWKPSYYTSSSNRDERLSKRVSDRVRNTFSCFKPSETYTFCDPVNFEYWATYDGTTVINNYANDTWFIFKGIKWKEMCRWNGSLWCIGLNSGLYLINDIYDVEQKDYDGVVTASDIDAEWYGAQFSAGREQVLKWSIDQYVSMVPTSDGLVEVSMKSDLQTETEAWTVRAVEDAPMATVHRCKRRVKAWSYLQTILRTPAGYGAHIVGLDHLYRAGTNTRRE